MANKKLYASRRQPDVETTPFLSVEEAWFWFVQAQLAKNDGARVTAGQALIGRPCEPIDIYRAVDRLYRQRRLLRDHLYVLKHYGCRQMRPDDTRVKEMRAARLWHEAMERLALPLERKGIVATPMMAYMEAAE